VRIRIYVLVYEEHYRTQRCSLKGESSGNVGEEKKKDDEDSAWCSILVLSDPMFCGERARIRGPFGSDLQDEHVHVHLCSASRSARQVAYQSK